MTKYNTEGFLYQDYKTISEGENLYFSFHRVFFDCGVTGTRNNSSIVLWRDKNDSMSYQKIMSDSGIFQWFKRQYFWAEIQKTTKPPTPNWCLQEAIIGNNS